MSNFSLWRTLAALALAFAAVDHARADSAAMVSVRIYDGAAGGADARDGAIRTASAILAEAGLQTAWHDGTGDSIRRSCNPARGDRELIIRIVPAFAPVPGRSRGFIETRTRAEASGVTLGFAVVDAATGAGTLATIFMDRVHATATRTAVTVSSLLGRAIAHEIGHLLLGTTSHARRGIMREVWTDDELGGDRRDDWSFSTAERRALETAAARRRALAGPATAVGAQEARSACGRGRGARN